MVNKIIWAIAKIDGQAKIALERMELEVYEFAKDSVKTIREIAKEALSNLANAHDPEPCRWKLHRDTFEPWTGSCGIEWSFTDGGPIENGVNYCPKCGNPVELVSDSCMLEEAQNE